MLLHQFEFVLGFGAHKAAVDPKRELLLVANQNPLEVGDKPLPVGLRELEKSEEIDDEDDVVRDVREVNRIDARFALQKLSDVL